MSSENSQGYLWIPCEFYSSLANQIMCNKQSALELRINVDLAIFHPYLSLEAGDNQSLKIQVARPGIEPRFRLLRKPRA